MTNVTGDEYDELSARVSALESQVGSLRARTADVRGEIAHVHDAVQDVREVQREHTARLDEHFEFHQSHAAGLAMLAETAREHGEALREILRRLDVA